ncbi:MAG: hypothetical protein HYY46_18545 [Deltaproteobacteria bacterium]|nr:hypothetical protein [Deltaproteobacteria bacterium]
MRSLTPEENAEVRREVWWTWVAITFFIVLAWMALPKAHSSGSSSLLLIATAFFAVVFITLIRHVWQLRADLSDGRAHIMTGTVDAVWRSGRRPLRFMHAGDYRIRVGNEVYRISEDMYDEVDEGDMVQMEFLPRSHLVFALEVIDTGEGTEEAEEVEDDEDDEEE